MSVDFPVVEHFNHYITSAPKIWKRQKNKKTKKTTTKKNPTKNKNKRKSCFLIKQTFMSQQNGIQSALCFSLATHELVQ